AERLELAMAGLLRERAGRVTHAAARLKHPREQLAEAQRHLDLVAARLRPALDRAGERSAERLAAVSMRLCRVPVPQGIERRGAELAQHAARLDAAAKRVTVLPE